MTLSYSDELGQRVHTGSTGASKWVAGLLLTLTLTALFGALQLYLASTEGTANQAHRRAVNALAEGDAIIARGFDRLQAEADLAEPGEQIALRDWPVQVTVSREEALEATPESLRELLLARSADKLYADGAAEAFRDAEADGDPGRFSAAGAVEMLLDLLRRDIHIASLITMIILGLTAGALTVWLASATRGYGRLIAVGICATLAALPVLLSGLAFRSAMDDGGGDYLRSELMAIGADLAMLPVRTGGALVIAGTVITIIAVICARIAARRPRTRDRRCSRYRSPHDR